MYAIIAIGGKQYEVQKGSVIEVERFDAEVGKTVDIADVLLVDDGKTVMVGAPTVPKTTVRLKVLEHTKDKKVEVRRFKAKSRYRRNRGFRQHITKLEIMQIA